MAKGIIELDENSDLMVAIKLAEERRNEKVTDLADTLVEGASKDKRDFIYSKIDELLEMNENIKVMHDAVVAVSIYKANNSK